MSAGSHETSTLSHEMRIDRQKLRKNCNFTCAGATLSHEMRVDRQKLRKNCDFTCPGATLSHEMRVHAGKIAILLVPEQPFRTKRCAKTEKKNCDFTCAGATPFARNEGRSSKTEEKLRFHLCWSNPFARNEGR